MVLTEKEKQYILTEASKMLLTEDQEGDSIKKAILLYMRERNVSKEVAEKFVRITLRESLPNLRNKKCGKFILGVTRMYLNNELLRRETVDSLNFTLSYVASDAHYNEYDKNLNGLTATQLISRFSDAVKQDAAKDKERLSQKGYSGNTQYKIVRINTFEEAKEYAQYCDWCITRSNMMLNSYTNDGVGQFYFCLKNGFENVPRKEGQGCPLDEYGLSMIAVCVDGEGRLKTCTCRWNHDNGGNDKIMSTEQISDVIGVNFYDIFKPNKKWLEMLESINQRLASGEDINKIFKCVRQLHTENCYLVKIDNKYNVYNEVKNQLISKVWFDDFRQEESNGLISFWQNNDRIYLDVVSGDSYTLEEYLNKKIKTIEIYLSRGMKPPKEMFDHYNESYSGDIEVSVFWYRTLITKDLKFPLKRFFISIDALPFNDKTYYRIMEIGSSNFKLVDENENNIIGGEYLFIGNTIYENGSLRIRDEEGYNIINVNNNKKMLPYSFKDNMKIISVGNNKYFYAGSNKEDEWVILNNEFKQLTNEIYEQVSMIGNEDVLYIKQNGLWNMLNHEGEILSHMWFDKCDHNFSLYNHLNVVEKNGLKNIFNTQTRRLLSKTWFEHCQGFSYDNKCIVCKNNVYNVLTMDGQFLFDEWYDVIENENLMYIIKKDGLMNISNKEGVILFDEWFDEVFVSQGDFYVEKDGNTKKIPYSLWNNRRYEKRR